MKKRIAAVFAVLALVVLGLLALPVYADTPEAIPSETAEQEVVPQEADSPEAIEQEAVPELSEATEPEVASEATEATEPEATEPEATEPEAAPLGAAEQEAEPEPQGAEAPELVTGETFSPEGDLLTYEVLSADEKTVAVTGGNGWLNSITIPATVTYNGETYKVTEIASGAFENFSTIRELTFAPNSNLVAIRANAFAYNAKSGSVVPATIHTLTFPASLEVVEDGAFHGIPVEHFALEDGSKLREIPCGFLAADGRDGYPGEETEGEGFFDFIHGLLFESASFTPEQVARACDCLQSVDFGDGNSLALIGMGAFKNQTHLTSIDFGEDPVAPELVICNGVFVAAGNNGAAASRGEEELGGIDTLVLPVNLAKIGEGIPVYAMGTPSDSRGDSGSFNYARVRHLVFSDGCPLEVVPEGFFEIGGEGWHARPGQHWDNGGTSYPYDDDIYTFVEDPVQIAANCLETVSFGDDNHLTIIENGAFRNQSHMTAIDFGTSASAGLTIDEGAFIGVGNNGYLVEQGVDSKLNAGVVNLTLPANLVALNNGAFEYARIIHLTFSDGCLLKKIPTSFMGVTGRGNNGHPGQGSDGSFIGDQALLAAISLESIDFGDNNHLTSINTGAFYNQSHLTSIDFGTPAEGVGNISIDTAFVGAGNNGFLVQSGVDDELNEGIDTLVLPTNLSNMSTGTLCYARVKNLVFSDGCPLTKIPGSFMGVIGGGNHGHPGQDRDGNLMDDQALLAAISLESISFGDNNHLTDIESGAFYNQSHLTSIDFGTPAEGVGRVSIGVAFVGAGNNGFLVQCGAEDELNEGIDTLTLPTNLSSLSSGSFGLARVKHLVFSDGCPLRSIPSSFMAILGTGTNGHPGQTKDGDYVEDQAQIAASCLESVDFGDDNNLSYINSGVFHNQCHLTDIDFGTPNENVHGLTIDSGAFVGVGNNSYYVENGADDVLSEGIETLTLPAHVTSLPNGAFDYAGIMSLEFSDGIGITRLNPGSFQDLDLMEELVLGEDCTLTELGGGAFSSCDRLTTVDLRDSGITTIDDAFKENPELTCVYFPEALEAVTWSNSDKEEKCPFYGCDALDELHFAATDPADYSFDDGVFQFLPDAGVVFLPEGTSDEAVDAYVEKLTAAGLTFGEDNWFITTARPLTVTFEANGGTGKMRPVTVVEGASFTLPACEFTAPKGKVFDGWDAGAVGATIEVTDGVTLTAQWKDDVTLIPIYRMYNTKTSEHLWTKSKKEYESCGSGNYVDWKQENIAWYSPNLKAPASYADSTQGDYVYVYRLYDKGRTGDHIYLTYGDEMKQYLADGWVVDKGAGFWTLKQGATFTDRTTIPIYRAYNPKLKRGKHHYTPSKNEYDSICKNHGWKPEGVKFYVVKK